MTWQLLWLSVSFVLHSLSGIFYSKHTIHLGSFQSAPLETNICWLMPENGLLMFLSSIFVHPVTVIDVPGDARSALLCCVVLSCVVTMYVNCCFLPELTSEQHKTRWHWHTTWAPGLPWHWTRTSWGCVMQLCNATLLLFEWYSGNEKPVQFNRIAKSDWLFSSRLLVNY